MTGRPRILFVSPRLPFPLNSGVNIRIANILRALVQVGDVDVLCAVGVNRLRRLRTDLPELPDWCRGLKSLRLVGVQPWREEEPRRFRARLARRLVARDPMLYSTFPLEPLRDLVMRLGTGADVVWAERLFVAQALPRQSASVVVDLDDLESVKLRREADAEPSTYLRWMMRREADRLAAVERAAPERFARVAVCSGEDRRFFAPPPERVWVVPNGVDDALLDRAPLPKLPHRLVFVGTMGYKPNEQAVLHFVREILPKVRASIPTATLAVVGLKPPQSIRDLHDGRTVWVYPDVPDVAPFVQEAAVSVVPLLVGGGTRLKILESLALGTPVVSTRVGAEGLDLDDNEHLLLADSPEDFAEAVVRTLRDEDTARRIAQSGRRRVEERYMWSAIRASIASKVLDLAESKRHTASARGL